MSSSSLVVAVVAGMASVAVAQDPGTSIAIAFPTPDSYVSGTVQLEARVEPRTRATDVTQLLFYADGRLVCTVMDPTRPGCPWDAGPDVREHVIRVVAELRGGGRLVASTRTKKLDHSEKVTVEVVQLTAVVSERHRFISGLPSSAFQVKEDGVPQRIQHFSAEGSPLELVVCIDVSGSMADAMPQLKNAVRKFLAALGAKDQVTLAAFNDSMFTLARRGTTAEQRLRAVDRLAPWGGTALYDVIVRGVQLLSKQPGRRVLVVFSDGDDRSSHATIATVEEAVRANDATLFMVALGRGVRDAPIKTGIEKLVALSGGRVLFVERSEQLAEPFAAIIEELSNQYVLGYESTNSRRDGGWRAIELTVQGQDYAVRTRQGYRAPTK